MQKNHRLFFILLLSPFIIYCQDIKNIRITFGNDVHRSMIIGWNGNSNLVVLYDTIPLQNNLKMNRNNNIRSVRYKHLTHHFCELTDLAPGKKYYLMFADTLKKNQSREYFFYTIPLDIKRLVLVVGGDSRNSVPIYEKNPKEGRKARIKGNELVCKITPDAVLFNGDFVLNRTGVFGRKEWDKWLNDWQYTISSDGQLIPIIPSIGNHENNLDLKNIFGIPENTTYYQRTFGEFLNIFTLNNNSRVCSTEQTQWLDSSLRVSPKSAWSMVQYHAPALPMGTFYSPRRDVIECWWSLFNHYQIDLVSEAHAHIMKTTYPVTVSNSDSKTFIRNDSIGTIIVGEGSWGAPLRTHRLPDSNTFGLGVYHGFHLVVLTTDSMKVYQINFNQQKTNPNSTIRDFNIVSFPGLNGKDFIFKLKSK